MISSEFQEFPAESTAEQVYEEPKNEAKDEYYFDESGDNTPFDMSLIRQDHNLTLRSLEGAPDEASLSKHSS